MSKGIPMHRSNVLNGVRGALVACALGCVVTHAALGENRPATASTGIEMQFLDPRIPAEERQVLESSVGYGLPPLSEGAAWVGDSGLDLAGLRGKVVVIQSYTRGDADGRAALRRTEDILKNIGADGVQLIALHTPEDAEDAATFFTDKPPTVPTILDRVGAFCDELGVYTRPVTIMVDRSGRIRYVGVALARLRPAVELVAAEPFDANSAVPEPLPPRATRIAEGNAPPGVAAPPAADRPAFPPKPRAGTNARDVFGKQGPSIDGLVFLTDKPETEGKVVMVEFWATWCGPCIGNIPHLNELHAKFRDSVAIMGVTKESESDVRNFKKGPKMEYSVALDKGGAINKALAIQGIPHAIIMSPDGIVRWQGHPAQLDEKTVQQIVDASGVTPGGGPAKPKRWVMPS